MYLSVRAYFDANAPKPSRRKAFWLLSLAYLIFQGLVFLSVAWVLPLVSEPKLFQVLLGLWLFGVVFLVFGASGLRDRPTAVQILRICFLGETLLLALLMGLIWAGRSEVLPGESAWSILSIASWFGLNIWISRRL